MRAGGSPIGDPDWRGYPRAVTPLPGTGASPSPGARRPGRGRRDRHGRGLRGPLAPTEVPLSLTRAEQFDELVLASLDRLEPRWSATLDAIEVVVADVPDVAAGSPADTVPLGHAEPARGDQPARLVVHRRPVESRAHGLRAREDLVHQVVVEQLAALLGLDPGVVDPDADDD